MTPTQTRPLANVCLAFLMATMLTVGCARKDNEDHLSFDSPEAAVAALVGAIEKNDTDKLQHLLGTGSEDLLSSGDAVQDARNRADFVVAYRKAHTLHMVGTEKMTALIGEKEWPFPIPVSKRNGRWYLDGKEGADELVYRRIGANELGAIGVCRGFVQAQHEYAAQGRDGDAAGIYALKLISDEGLHNGLYWRTDEVAGPSPAGPFVAAAAAEGYRAGARQPYHGYYYRMLYRQGEHANGGGRDYFNKGLLTEGFALVAWPAQYQVSGVMTFIVNPDGVVFQKDLGQDTEAVVARMTAFDPDGSWVAVTESAGA